MVKVKCHNLLGEDFEAEYTEAQYAQLRERRRNQEEEERRVSDIWEAGLREHQRRQEEAARHPDLDAIDHALPTYQHRRKRLQYSCLRNQSVAQPMSRAWPARSLSCIRPAISPIQQPMFSCERY